MFRFHRPSVADIPEVLSQAELAREVRRLQIAARRRVNDLFAGEYHSAFKGHGIEFAEVREYEPGDDVRTIDWNVTARTGKPFIKRFVEERQLTVIVCVDVSASGLFGTRGRFKRRLEIECAAVLAMAATRNQDRVGLQVFSERVERFIPPAKGSIHCQRLIRDLLAHRPAARGTSIAAAVEHLTHMLKRRSVIFLISDFESPPYDKQLRTLAQRHDVVAVTVSDPAEASLPSLGLVDVIDPETGRLRVLDLSGSRRRSYASTRARTREARDRMIASTGADHIALRTDRPFVADIAAYFRKREHRR